MHNFVVGDPVSFNDIQEFQAVGKEAVVRIGIITECGSGGKEFWVI